MDAYIVVMTGFGVIVLLTAWLPMLLKELPLSLPIVCVAIGAGLFSIPGMAGAALLPLAHLPLIERVTELVVIISLMGAGLKLDRPLRWGSAAATWRLLGIAMPLTIVALALLGAGVLGLGAAAAILLGAALAPTDPVLASDVQVGPPHQGQEDAVRFALTAEAGLNDGLAFPFVKLAIIVALTATGTMPDLGLWFAVDVLWRVAAGIGVGWLVGRSLGWLIFRLPNRTRISRCGDGLVALGATFIAYGAGELVHGYGFVAVFVAALGIRAAERNHHYQETLHQFTEQVERLLMMVLLVLFGGAAAAGGLFEGLTWEIGLYAAMALFVIRPVAGWISLLGARLRPADKSVIAVFGIRGIGSVYYLAYALNRASFEQAELLWKVIAVIVFASIFLHGTTITPVMRRLDGGREPAGPAAAGDDSKPRA